MSTSNPNFSIYPHKYPDIFVLANFLKLRYPILIRVLTLLLLNSIYSLNVTGFSMRHFLYIQALALHHVICYTIVV